MGLKQPEDKVEPPGFPWLSVCFLFAVLVGGTLAWEFVVGPVAVADGGYDLTVSLSASPGTIKSVRCQAFGRQDIAGWAMTDPDSPEFTAWTRANPFQGKPVAVPIQFSIKTSPFGREFDRVQSTSLVVIADMQDGTQVTKLVPIPDSRVSQSVTVTLP